MARASEMRAVALFNTSRLASLGALMLDETVELAVVEGVEETTA